MFCKFFDWIKDLCWKPKGMLVQTKDAPKGRNKNEERRPWKVWALVVVEVLSVELGKLNMHSATHDA